MDNRDSFCLLNKRVDLLKKDIQDIIDNYKSEKNLINKQSLQDQKNIYLEELDTILSQIKKIQKEDKQKLMSENQIKKIIRTNDSMKYHSVKNKSNSRELMQEQKDNRYKAKDIFDKKCKLKDDYHCLEKQYGCQDFPAFLFFYKEISDKYKLCPFIELNEITCENRKQWLLNTFDKGELYYNLYNKIINKDSLNILLSSKDDIERYFGEIHDTLDESSKKNLEKIKEYIDEYKSASIKTKKLKEKFNIIINNTSTIVKNSNFKVNEFLSLYYDIVIPVNNIVENEINIMTLGISRIYDDKLEQYIKVKNDIENATKFIFNSKNNLNQELYDHLYKKSIEKKNTKQVGKYFKKWSELSKEEKLDRLDAYSDN